MLTLVCHRCGFTAAPGHAHEAGHGRVQCPADGLFLVTEDDHRRAPRDTYLGSVLGGRYPILGLIGLGGMGSVYRSVQPPVDRPVAIKVIHPRVSLGDTAVDKSAEEGDAIAARFLREARLIAALSHPNIVTMHDFGTEPDGTLYMVQELLEGDALRRALPVLTPRALVAVMLELLDALTAAHALGLVHRDVKPENIMLMRGWTADGLRPRVKLLDFGIARRVGAEDSGRLTTQGAIFGTPVYMAPEQAQGSDHVDARADLYAVGVMLYEGLAGRPPYNGVNALAILVQVLSGARPPLVPRTPVPPALVKIVDRALSREPEDRFESAEAMARALAALEWPAGDAVLHTAQMSSGHRTLPLSSRPLDATGPTEEAPLASAAPPPAVAIEVSAPPVPEAEPEPDFTALMARPPLAWRAGAAVVVGALLGGLAWLVGGGLKPAAAPAPAAAPLAVVTTAPITAPPTLAPTAAPATSPATALATSPATAPATSPAPRKPKRPNAPSSSGSSASSASEEILAPPPR